jgi:tetratricopeptide (TPR) repeat protein
MPATASLTSPINGPNDLYRHGNELFKHGDYARALGFFERAAAGGNFDYASIGKAQCLAHLSRQDEALRILTKIQLKDPLCDKASEIKATVYMDAGQYMQALEACNYLEDHTVSILQGIEEACLLRSSILEKMGRKGPAIEQAQRAYYRCKHLGRPTEAAEKRLEALDAVPQYIPNTEANDLVFSTIRQLCSLKADLTPEQLQQIIGRHFEECIKPNQGYYLTSIQNGELFSNVQLRGDVDRSHSWIQLVVDPDVSSISQEEIEHRFGMNYEISDVIANHSSGTSHRILYHRPFGSIEFQFETCGSQCLTIFWVDLIHKSSSTSD